MRFYNILKKIFYRIKLSKFNFLPITLKKYNYHELSKKRFFVCYSLIKKNNFKNILEIGSYRGDLTYFLLKNLQNINLTSIDPYLEYVAENNVSNSGTKMQNLRNDLLSNLSNEIDDNRFQLIQDFSHNCFNNFNDGYFDFIFIDGDHSYESCLKDLTNYYNKVRKGGIICLHDYDRKTVPGVKKAVDEFVLNNQITLIKDMNYCVHFIKS